MIELSSIKTPNNKLERILIFYFGHCQVCTECEAERTYVRTFDVTEKTALRRHNTGRLCHICGSKLRDTIVHFGEKGSLEWPLNWQGAIDAGKATDCIVCLGSSLKVHTMGTWFKCCMHIWMRCAKFNATVPKGHYSPLICLGFKKIQLSLGYDKDKS